MTRRSIFISAAVVAALLAGGAPAPASAAPPPGGVAATGSTAAEPDAARASARLSGTPVEVLSRRTERERLLANPDGSWTAEMSAVPTRVRRADGTWTGVDTTLRAGADGVTAEAVVGDLRFSGGGSGPAARVAVGGREVRLGAPWPLPQPRLDGPRATYTDVLPGVDLVLTALPEGFSEVLVVRDRAAAANPALRALTFSLDTTGLTLRAHDGGFEAVDPAGRVTFTSPAPAMWDSSAAGTSAASRTVDVPVQGDRTARMATAIDGRSLTVTPDTTLLADPATRFPLYIDPAVTAARNEWAMISSGFGGDDPHYKFSGDEGVGLCDVQTVSSCSADQVKRLVWEFGLPAAVKSSHVLGATFRAYETHAYDCTADAVQLWRTNSISSSTTWDNHSGGWAAQVASVSVARKSGCTNGPGWVEFGATSAAVLAASSNWGTLTLGLKAGNEGSMPGGWKRFRNDATLSITYNSAPRVPTTLSAEGTGCTTGAGRPSVTTATPTLRAVVSDPDTETDLRAAFAWEQLSGTTWTALGSGTQSSLTSGGTGLVKIPSGLVNDGVYRWRAQTQDPWSFNGSSGTDSSAWSGYCEFRVDTVSPNAAPAVSSPVYGADLNQVYGAVGRTADFTFAAGGDPDVTSYRWGWADPPTTAVAAPTPGAAVTLPLTPPPPKPADPTSGGQTTLHVVAVDQAGRTSPMTTYVFNLGSATAPLGVWNLADPAGSGTLADATTRGPAHPLTLTGGGAGSPGRILNGPAKAAPTAVTFNGTGTYAATAGPVLDTAHSFSFSAWARPTATKWAAVLGQRASVNGSFDLQYASNNTWALTTYSTDGSPTVVRAQATTASALNQWVYLAGVYDAGARQTQLYVNGVLAGTASVPAMWNATGPFEIGRSLWLGGYYNAFSGDIAEVKVWDRVISAPELAADAGALVGRWRLDGDGTDATPYGRTATATGTVTWGDDRGAGPVSAAVLDGTTGSLSTAGPVVRTDQSYTVSAWARWWLGSANGSANTVAAQDGTVSSSFYLGCRVSATPAWSMLVRSADSGTSTPAYANGGSCAADEWAHITGVRDAAAGTDRLYVDGVLVATAPTAFQTWHATGGFTIGRAKWGGNLVDYFTGDIDEVQVYAGALPPAQVARLAG